MGLMLRPEWNREILIFYGKVLRKIFSCAIILINRPRVSRMRKDWSQEIRVQSCLAINLLFEHIKYNKKVTVYLLEHYMAEPLRPIDPSLSHITDPNVVWK